MQSNQTGQSNRYEVRFNNGYYKVFDNLEYNDVCLMYLKSFAEALVKQKNKGGSK